MQTFIKTLRRDPSTSTKVTDLFKAFIATAPDRAAWTRTRFVCELARLGLEIGRDSAKVAVVIGVSLTPPKKLRIVDGRVK